MPFLTFWRSLDRFAAMAASGGRGGHSISFAAGLLLTLAFPPFYLLPVVLLVFPFLARVLDHSRNIKEAARSGWWFGFGHFLTAFYWIGNSFTQQEDVALWLAPIAVIALTAILALYLAGAVALAKRFWTKGCARIIILAVCWGLAEWLRGHLFTGFPWNMIVQVWGLWDVMLQPLAALGSYGYGMLSIVVFSAPILLTDGPRKDSQYGFIVVAVLTVFMMAGGLYRINTASLEIDPSVRLRLVQANIPQREKWKPENWDRNIMRHLALSRPLGEHAASDDPRQLIVIWPETAVPYNFATTRNLGEVLAEQLGNQAILLTGAPTRMRDDQGLQLYNSLYGVGPLGAQLFRYDKAHLVPFGEYIPLRALFDFVGLNKLVPGETDFLSGPGPQTISIDGVPAFSPLICYEIIFPGRVTDDQGGARWIINVTNDAWFGDSAGPRQHLEIARLRAVEEGLPVVRSTPTGISAIINPYGQITASLGLGQQGVVDGDLPAALENRPFYPRYGNGVFFSLLIGLLALSSLLKRNYNGQ